MQGSKYTDEQRQKFAAMMLAGMSQTEAARELGIPKSTASCWAQRLADESDEYAAALYDLLLFCVKTGKAMQAAENVQSLMQIVEKNISSRFRDEKYDLRLKKLYEKIQKM